MALKSALWFEDIQLSLESEEINVDIHDLVSGFYLLKINSCGQTIYRDRLIITK